MTTANTNLFLRNDTVFGICEAVGQDFGFNANWLRIPLCAGLLWNPVAMVAAYALLGVLVAVTRFALPDRVDAVPQPTVQPQLVPEQRTEEEQRELIAA